MMPGSSNYDWDGATRQSLLEGHQALASSAQSIVRSQQIAIETEQIGTEVISDLNDQRETLLRTKSRLTTADDELARSKNILRRMSRNVVYNKLILIGIILLEVGILGILIYIKFFKPKH